MKGSKSLRNDGEHSGLIACANAADHDLMPAVRDMGSPASAISLPSPASLWPQAFRISPALSVTMAIMAGGAALSLVGIFADARTLLGAPIWLKPFKFFVSFTLLLGTVLFFLAQLTERSRLVPWVNAGLAVGALAEMVGIAGQAARGTMSHFNVSTAFDIAVFGMMGTMIVVFQLAVIGLAVVLIRQPIANRSVAAGIRTGLIAMIVGTLATGVPMIASSSPDEHAATAAKYGVKSMGGGHAVGAPDDVPGVPFIGWSTLGGDLRVGHFLSLHALQLLPLFGWIISRRQLSTQRAVAITRGAGIAYFGLILVLTWQALRAQSVIAPDAATLAVAGLAVIAGVGYALIAGRTS